MLTGAALDQAIQQLHSRPQRNTFFRAMLLRYASDPLGKRRPINAQRFNIAGGARVLYLAEDHFTCLQEIQAFSWPATSTAIVPVQFDLKAIVDLRDPAVQSLLQSNPSELVLNFRSVIPGPAPTQTLGRTLRVVRANRRSAFRIASSARESRFGGNRDGPADARIFAYGQRSAKQSSRQIAVNSSHRRFPHLDRPSD